MRGVRAALVPMDEGGAQPGAAKSGVEKLIAVMVTDQRAAIAIFESLGFRAEALPRGQVMDREGRKHDIALPSHDVNDVQSRMAAYGLSDAA